MFLDSSIHHYRQGRRKVKYVIESGISPYVNKLAKGDLKNQPCTCHFDETATKAI